MKRDYNSRDFGINPEKATVISTLGKINSGKNLEWRRVCSAYLVLKHDWDGISEKRTLSFVLNYKDNPEGKTILER
ncbi:hypothetical protein [Aquiflexum gelatinilyticum]|uniref:hypothetical protein n=1 Tax=Aquiflexum gelatinilyticum TaxID=2961943 RepID=UPI002168B808|nr:hypothetical protein [Aquiflexum gelatinilyticum]MCS4432844.1 hypothetical protein [Aquiflexum gelatinilyticum]